MLALPRQGALTGVYSLEMLGVNLIHVQGGSLNNEYDFSPKEVNCTGDCGCHSEVSGQLGGEFLCCIGDKIERTYVSITERNCINLSILYSVCNTTHRKSCIKNSVSHID